jgi:hypothetical protein
MDHHPGEGTCTPEARASGEARPQARPAREKRRLGKVLRSTRRGCVEAENALLSGIVVSRSQTFLAPRSFSTSASSSYILRDVSPCGDPLPSPHAPSLPLLVLRRAHLPPLGECSSPHSLAPDLSSLRRHRSSSKGYVIVCMRRRSRAQPLGSRCPCTPADARRCAVHRVRRVTVLTCPARCAQTHHAHPILWWE